MTAAHEGKRLQGSLANHRITGPLLRQAPAMARFVLPLVVTATIFLFDPLLVRPAVAHEIRPMIATLSIRPKTSLRIILSLNLEAAIAGIGADHENTSDSPAAPLYDRLRALPPDALLREFEEFAPMLLERIAVSSERQPPTSPNIRRENPPSTRPLPLVPLKSGSRHE